MYQQVLDPIANSLGWSSLVATLPLLLLFVLLGVLRVTAWVASVVSLILALAIAIFVYGMPVGQALLAGSEGRRSASSPSCGSSSTRSGSTR